MKVIGADPRDPGNAAHPSHRLLLVFDLRNLERIVPVPFYARKVKQSRTNFLPN